MPKPFYDVHDYARCERRFFEGGYRKTRNTMQVFNYFKLKPKETMLIEIPLGDSAEYVIRHYATDIIRFHPEGSVTLSPNGYHTETFRRHVKSFTKVSLWWDAGKVMVSGTHAWTRGTDRRYQGQMSDRSSFRYFPGLCFEERWMSQTVIDLVRGLVQNRAWANQPILADALQDAGCEWGEMLTTLRLAEDHEIGPRHNIIDALALLYGSMMERTKPPYCEREEVATA